jgi:hypothetical protein
MKYLVKYTLSFIIFSVIKHLYLYELIVKTSSQGNLTDDYLPEKQHQALNKAAKIVMAMNVRRSRFQQYVTKHLYKQNSVSPFISRSDLNETSTVHGGANIIQYIQY